MALAPVLLLLYATLAVGAVADGRQYDGRVHPNVRMLDMDLGGEKPLEVVRRLDQATSGGGIATYSFELDGRPPSEESPGADPEVFRWRGRDLGVDFDVYGSAQRAYDVGRAGGVPERLADRLRARLGPLAGLEPRRVEPDVSYRPEAAGAAVREMARALARGPKDAVLTIGGGAAPRAAVTPHERGLEISEEGTLANLRAALLRLETGVDLVAARPNPKILTPAAEEAADKAGKVLSGGPVVVEDPEAERFGTAGSYEVAPAALAPLLAVSPDPEEGEIRVGLDPEALGARVAPIVEAATLAPSDASLYFDAASDGVEVEEARPGRAPDGGALQKEMEGSLFSGRKSFELKGREVEPALTTAEAEKLRPDALLGGYTTAYRPGGGGAEETRFGNLSAAAAAVDGTLVPPGETFSLLSSLEAQGLSPADFDPGGAPEAYVSDPERPERPPVDDAAGLSQFSSTLYASALLSGLEITARSSAPSAPLPYVDAGLEAYVGADSGAAGDLAFRNATDAYLLLRAETDGAGEVRVVIEGRPGAFPGDGGPARELVSRETEAASVDPAAQEAWTAALVDGRGEERAVSTDAYYYDPVEPEPEPVEPEEGPQEQGEPPEGAPEGTPPPGEETAPEEAAPASGTDGGAGEEVPAEDPPTDGEGAAEPESPTDEGTDAGGGGIEPEEGSGTSSRSSEDAP